MSNTMLQFKETISEINNLRNKEKLLTENFEQSTGELAECFGWLLKAALEGDNHCCLSIFTCPELYAKELRGMGFEVKEMRNDAKTLYGYDITLPSVPVYRLKSHD